MTYSDIISFFGFYLIVIGTWRLANATQPVASSGPWAQIEGDKSYRPYRDLVSPHLVLLWIYQTIKSFRNGNGLSSAAILQRQFNWGLLWLLLGIIIQYVSSFL